MPGPWPMPSMALVDVAYIFLVPRLARFGRVDAGDTRLRDMTPTTPHCADLQLARCSDAVMQ